MEMEMDVKMKVEFYNQINRERKATLYKQMVKLAHPFRPPFRSPFRRHEKTMPRESIQRRDYLFQK
jgi:hypothetical protein